jgi:hypothetical protein
MRTSMVQGLIIVGKDESLTQERCVPVPCGSNLVDIKLCQKAIKEAKLKKKKLLE